jgi:hypothetical protein
LHALIAYFVGMTAFYGPVHKTHLYPQTWGKIEDGAIGFWIEAALGIDS